jgi:hypothetical protein
VPVLPTPIYELWFGIAVPNPLTQLTPELSSGNDDDGEEDGEEKTTMFD